jgi:hypothetical protein
LLFAEFGIRPQAAGNFSLDSSSVWQKEKALNRKGREGSAAKYAKKGKVEN